MTLFLPKLMMPQSPRKRELRKASKGEAVVFYRGSLAERSYNAINPYRQSCRSVKRAGFMISTGNSGHPWNASAEFQAPPGCGIFLNGLNTYSR